ncbi:MAG TPA: glyoxalase [Acidimicrobiaceae bacterium]|nr:glyoxalase [Acidimicrobiaceae bacterium]
MSTNGFDHVYMETHDWAASVAFWAALGFEVEFSTDHGSGMLRNPAGGPTVFLAQQPWEDPLAVELYLAAPAGYEPPPGVEVVHPFTPTHWGTQVMVIRDPDGRRLRIESPLE